MWSKHRMRTRILPLLPALILGCALPRAAAQNANPPHEIPDSPSSIVAQQAGQYHWLPETTDSGSPPAQTQTPQSESHKPVGTAVAETPAAVGVAASNPAGAAIAPPKQRRVRTILIKVGAIVGAGVAIGTVAALATASPSTPPGSRQ